MDIYHLYDEIVATTIDDLVQKTGAYDNLSLGNFDINDKEHLYLYSIIRMLGDLQEKPVNINTDLFTEWCMKWKFRKLQHDILYNQYPTNINVENFIRQLKLKHDECNYVGLDEIYNAYYNPKFIRKGLK